VLSFYPSRRPSHSYRVQCNYHFLDEELEIKRRSIAVATFLVLLQLRCGLLQARPITAYQAEKMVAGWLKADARPLCSALGRRVIRRETFTDDSGEPVYYAIYLRPGGFVIVSADDLIEPIIGFADNGIYDPSDDNPLRALVTGDLKNRITAARANYPFRPITGQRRTSTPQSKWSHFIRLGEASDNGFGLMGLLSISDIRVAPLMQSQWAQTTCCTDPALACYNYFTPEQYHCGCVATAMAQLMRYYQHPTAGIGVHRFTITVDGNSQTAYTLGGGSGGAYDWSRMIPAPDCAATEAQRRAIGALCYDASISVNTDYGPDGSTADTHKAKDALMTTFEYGNAVQGYNDERDIGPGLIGMINPNLDAKKPVIIGIKGSDGHAVVCDGYGYNASTLYHHLNMGWAGSNDVWYNLPIVETSNYAFNSVIKCVYNIHITKTGDGEMISGRVLDRNGGPVANAVVYARAVGQSAPISADSDDRGIYAFDSLNSDTTYIVWPQANGHIFSSRNVTTGTSRDNAATAGNVWGIDFVAFCPGDFDGDSDIDAADFAIFASAWLAGPRDDLWNPDCDISNPADSIIDALDLAVFVDDWLAGVE